MSSKDAELKSAYELAMERLKAEDKKTGRRHKALTAEQKLEIQRLRRDAEAKLAELEILHRKNLGGTDGDPQKIAEVEEHYRIDRGRVESHLDSAIRRVKKA